MPVLPSFATFATLATLFVALLGSRASHAQVYNPDADFNGYVQVSDLQAFLAWYGLAFTPASATDSDSLLVVSASNLPNGAILTHATDVLDCASVPDNFTVFLPNPNASNAHGVAVLLGGAASVHFHPQTGAYALSVSSGYAQSNTYTLAILVPFMGKWWCNQAP